MEAKLNELSKLDLRSLCGKKLLGIPIDSVIKGRRKQFSKTDLIKKILEKGDVNIQTAIDKKKHDPGAFLADDTIVSDDESNKSPVKDMFDSAMNEAKLKKLAEDKAVEATKLKKLSEEKGNETIKSFGKQYFKKWQNASEYKKMTKKELVDFMEAFEESHGALGNSAFGAMRQIEHNKHDDEAKVRVSDIEGKNRSSLEDETIANLRRIIRQKQGETPKPKPKYVEVLPKKENETPKKTGVIAQKGEPPKQKQGYVLPKKPDEFEKEKAQEDQFKKITRKNVGKIDLSVKVEDDNVKVKPNVKISDIKKAIQKNSSRLKLSKPPKIVYHSLKNMGKTALLTI